MRRRSRASPSSTACATTTGIRRTTPRSTIGGGHRLWAGTYGRFAYLFVDGRRSAISSISSQPGQTPYGDRIVLAAEPGVARWWLLNTAAPGAFRAQETGPDRFEPSEVYDGRVIGAWQETASGYSLEVRVPLNLIGDALGVGVIDVDRSGADYVVALDATWDEATGAAGAVHPAAPRATERCSANSAARAAGSACSTRTAGCWRRRAASTPGTAGDDGAGLLGGLFRWLLEREDPPYPPERPGGPRRRRDVAPSAARPRRDGVVRQRARARGDRRGGRADRRCGRGVEGAVVLEQASEPILTLTNRALVRLMTLTLLATLVVGVGLLGYATWLSLRVRRLAGAAQTALGPRGEIRSGMPGAAAGDEFGALARSFAELLERLREHTEYLRTLASKLSHELRTPLAVVTTSLDNLEHEVKAPAAEEYLGRLRQGAERLDAHSRRDERGDGARAGDSRDGRAAVRSRRRRRVVLRGVSRRVSRARDRLTVRRVRPATTVGSGELIAQLLDKLVDNAVSFSAPGSRIDVALAAAGDELVLSVANRGPPLPAKMRGRLFDSLVSIREQRDGRPHLGLGLHIVALVADFHGGRCEADDLPDGSGAVFRVSMPKR